MTDADRIQWRQSVLNTRHGPRYLQTLITMGFCERGMCQCARPSWLDAEVLPAEAEQWFERYGGEG